MGDNVNVSLWKPLHSSVPVRQVMKVEQMDARGLLLLRPYARQVMHSKKTHVLEYLESQRIACSL